MQKFLKLVWYHLCYLRVTIKSPFSPPLEDKPKVVIPMVRHLLVHNSNAYTNCIVFTNGTLELTLMSRCRYGFVWTNINLQTSHAGYLLCLTWDSGFEAKIKTLKTSSSIKIVFFFFRIMLINLCIARKLFRKDGHRLRVHLKLSFVDIDADNSFYGESNRNLLGVRVLCGVHKCSVLETVEEFDGF